MTDKKAINLEKSLNELEGLVEKLESGDSTLDQSLTLFEKGVSLYKDCKKELDKAEKKISKLTKSLKEEELA